MDITSVPFILIETLPKAVATAEIYYLKITKALLVTVPLAPATLLLTCMPAAVCFLGVYISFSWMPQISQSVY